MSLLRDICLATGIVIKFQTGSDIKDFIFENDTDKLKQAISDNKNASQHQGKGKKQKNAPQSVLPDNEIFTYENLPIQAEDIGDFFPILKHISV